MVVRLGGSGGKKEKGRKVGVMGCWDGKEGITRKRKVDLRGVWGLA